MAKVTTKAGFSVEVNDDLDDIEFLEMLSDLRNGDVLVIPILCRALIGNDGYKSLKEYYKDPATGKTSTTAISSAIGEIMQGLGEAKKK